MSFKHTHPTNPTSPAGTKASQTQTREGAALPNQEFRALEGTVADAQTASFSAAGLSALAARIRTADQGVVHAAANLIEHALAAGDALLAAKGSIPHGGWLAWLKRECDLSADRAERYMRIARGRMIQRRFACSDVVPEPGWCREPRYCE